VEYAGGSAAAELRALSLLPAPHTLALSHTLHIVTHPEAPPLPTPPLQRTAQQKDVLKLVERAAYGWVALLLCVVVWCRVV